MLIDPPTCVPAISKFEEAVDGSKSFVVIVSPTKSFELNDTSDLTNNREFMETSPLTNNLEFIEISPITFREDPLNVNNPPAEISTVDDALFTILIASALPIFIFPDAEEPFPILIAPL